MPILTSSFTTTFTRFPQKSNKHPQDVSAKIQYILKKNSVVQQKEILDGINLEDSLTILKLKLDSARKQAVKSAPQEQKSRVIESWEKTINWFNGVSVEVESNEELKTLNQTIQNLFIFSEPYCFDPFRFLQLPLGTIQTDRDVKSLLQVLELRRLGLFKEPNVKTESTELRDLYESFLKAKP